MMSYFIGSSIYTTRENINFRSAIFAVFAYTLIIGTFFEFVLQFSLKYLKLGQYSGYMHAEYLLVFIFNYVFLYNDKENGYYLTVKNSIPLYGYIIAVSLVFGWLVAILVWVYYSD